MLGDGHPDSFEYLPLGGDSGGGVFTRSGERWELVGIITGAVAIDLARVMEHGWYRQVGRFDRVTAHLEWIAATTGGTAATPGSGPPLL